jgi:hypothetical protein
MAKSWTTSNVDVSQLSCVLVSGDLDDTNGSALVVLEGKYRYKDSDNALISDLMPKRFRYENTLASVPADVQNALQVFCAWMRDEILLDEGI